MFIVQGENWSGFFCSMDFSSVAEANRATDTPNLMKLPAEIRFRIWSFLLVYQKTIPLVINYDGFITKVKESQRSLQILRLSRAVYYETCPILYGANTFKVRTWQMDNLTKFRQASRMCIERCKLVLRTDTDNSKLDEIDLDVIGQAMPYLRTLEIITRSPSALLSTTLCLSKSLPISTIRPTWPQLEVHVLIPHASLTSQELKQLPATPDQLNRHHSNLISKGKFALDTLTVDSPLRLGHEMPEFGTIKVIGTTNERLCRLIEDHTGAFGDCYFEKEIATEKEIFRKISKLGKVYKFTWRRRDDGGAVGKTITETTQTGLHRWVPRLPKEWYIKLLDAGCNVAEYGKNEAIVKAERKRKLETDVSLHFPDDDDLMDIIE